MLLRACGSRGEMRRHKPLAQAAGEIGIDPIMGRELLERFTHELTEVPAPEQQGVDPSAQRAH